MELKEILSKCDHTLLSQTATWEEIRALCDDGMKYGCASVCIPASYVKEAADYVAGKLPSARSSASPTAMTPPPPSALWLRTQWTTARRKWTWSSTWVG